MSTPFFLPTISDSEDKSSAFKNRIRKNYKHIRKWAKRTLTNCFRIYDRDIKEYPLAIDYYDGRFCVHFFTFSKEELEPSCELKSEVHQALSSIFAADTSQIYWRVRIKREKIEQYEKAATSKDFFTVLEYGLRFKVNLVDYLDTGLFLDHRETRQIVAKAAGGKRLLNLFAYTCSFSVQAAALGAIYTKSVDMSNTYTLWGKDNFVLNDLPLTSNVIVRDDCLKFLKEEILSSSKYDVIVIDPPTISRSKKMEDFFDIHEDYVELIQDALKLLTPEGTIYFSTNSRKFRFDLSLFPQCKIINISKKTLPIDFHNEKIHQCWTISLL